MRLPARLSAWPYLVAVLLFAILFVLNSWVGDDAYITFRSVDNFVHGHGLTWNTNERVQAFTNPLWLFVMSAAYAVTSEFHLTALVLSFLLGLGTFWILWKHFADPTRFAVLFLLLMSSKAFVDFTSSGLENPLAYLLLALFYTGFLRVGSKEEAPQPRSLALLCLVASLGFVNRPDSVLLYCVPILYLGYRVLRSGQREHLGWMLLGLCPALLWEMFSLVYFGFPFPNTYYAKLNLGLPGGILLKQGINYFENSLLFDPITLTGILAAIVLGAISRRGPLLAGVISLLFGLAYTLKIGGGFMSGRFFSLPFLLAAILVVFALGKRLEKRPVFATLALLFLAYNATMPWTPVKTDARKPWEHQFTYRESIYDEAGGYRRGTNLLLYRPFTDVSHGQFPVGPYAAWAESGKKLRVASRQVVVVSGATGYTGFFAGPEKYLIDRIGLSEPFLARLPVPQGAYFDYKPGHVLRDVPKGYVESRARGGNLVADPGLREYYEHLLVITQGELFTRERWHYIAEFNLGGKNLYQADR